MRVETQPSHGGALGANYNGRLIWIDHDELHRNHARWIRGFIEMHTLDDTVHLPQRPNIKAFLKSSNAGFKTIMSLKWAYASRDLPAPGSPELKAELHRLDRLLRILMGRVDILVIGNEPFIDTKPEQADERLNVFYETMADAVIAFRRARSETAISTRLYMGALNRLDRPVKRTPAVGRFLRYIVSQPDLDGVDLHPHMPNLACHKAMLDWVLPRIRPDQTFIATEFSLIWHWQAHLTDEASAYYREKYSLAPGTKVHEVIGAAILQPIPYDQWEDFLSHEPWYVGRRHFIANAMKLYRSTGRLAVATYCFCPMRDRKRPLLTTQGPWMMNAVVAPPTVQLKPDGTTHDNFPWADEFRRVQLEG